MPAGPITGTEVVAIVQNGWSVKTTTAALAGSPVQTQSFLTVNQEPSLNNSRTLAVGPGLSLADGGIQAALQINVTGALANLNGLGTGIMVKTGTSTMAPVVLATSGNGLSVTNDSGLAGNPTFQLTGLPAALASASGTGLLAVVGGTTLANRTLTGTASQIAVTNGNGADNPAISLASDPLIPGLAGITIPVGTTADRSVSAGVGTIRYSTSLNSFEGYTSTGWGVIVAGAAVTSFSAGTTGFTPSVPTVGSIVLGGILNVVNGGSGTATPALVAGSNVTITGTWPNQTINSSNPGGTVTAVTGTAPVVSSGGTTPAISMAAATTSVNGYLTSTDWNTFNSKQPAGTYVTSVSGTGTVNGITLTGTVTSTGSLTLGGTLGSIANSQLSNSAITINGSAVSLGGSTTVTATATNALTIGTGLSGTSYNGSAPVTVAIDSTVVTLTGTQVLTNKTLTAPVIKNNFKFETAGIAAYSQFAGTIGSWISNTNNFQVVYAENQNSGSDASADWVAYNDASDGASYFIDMGINSSGYTSVTYPIFSPNSAYLFTGGGNTGQQTDLYLGTSNAASDIIFFTGSVLVAAVRGSIQGDTGNWLINSISDTGEKLQVTGSAKITGAMTFGSTVLLNANPTLALQATTKQYVDTAVSTGFTVHPSVNLATTAALPANTYNNGALGVGATLTAVATGVLTIDSVTATLGMRVLIKNEVASANNGAYTVTVAGAVGVAYILTRATDFDQAAAGEIANNAYFLVTAGSTLINTSYVLSQVAAITVGTTALPFTLFATALTYTGGTNINVTGQVISLTGTVATTNGGTGTATVTVGDMLYGSATDTWSKLALGAAYKSLRVNASGTQLEWNSVALNQTAAVSGQLGVANGGTGASTLTGYVYGNGTGVMTAATTIPNTSITGLGTMSTQNASAVAITGGTIDNATIGATTATTGKFTTVTATTGISGGTF